MAGVVDQLWAVARQSPHVDAASLAAAVESAAAADDPKDYRTRLLIRDSLRALAAHWGDERLAAWLRASPARRRIEEACDPKTFDPDRNEIGFPSLTRRVVDTTKTETLLEFFRMLSRHVHEGTKLVVGGSVALMLPGLLSRHTEDVDVVDEVPADLRNQHDLLAQLAERFGLQLAHFQSHYLPGGWTGRIRSFQAFGRLDVYLVDPYDVMVSKLCSKRAKDLDDLRALKPQIDREKLRDRLTGSGAALLTEPRLREAAGENWYVLFGEELPA